MKIKIDECCRIPSLEDKKSEKNRSERDERLWSQWHSIFFKKKLFFLRKGDPGDFEKYTGIEQAVEVRPFNSNNTGGPRYLRTRYM